MKKRFLVRRGLLAVSLLVVGGGTAVALGSAQAGASIKQVTDVGSFTTYQMMHNIFGPSINTELPGGTTSHQQIVATPSLCATGINWASTNASTGKPGVPNGSTAGKKQLKFEEGTTTDKKGCITFSRSSSAPAPKTGTTSHLTSHVDYYAYALDGVGPMSGSHAGGTARAPIQLSITTVKNIYLCKPGYTTWNTITGTAPVVRFWPQTGSGTRSVYTSIMGFTPESLVGPTTTTSHGGLCGKSNKPITTFNTITGTHSKSAVNEENTEDGIIYYSSLPGNGTAIKNAIFIYSAGKFANEWNNPSVFTKAATNSINTKPIGKFNASTLLMDKMVNRATAGQTKVFDTYGSPSGTFNATTNRGTYTVNQSVVKESNEWFSHIASTSAAASTSSAAVPGVRYVYNVADTNLPGYSTAKALIGFDNSTTHTTALAVTVQGTKSALCHGDDSAAILASGFVPLNSGATMPAWHGDRHQHSRQGRGDLPSVRRTCLPDVGSRQGLDTVALRPADIATPAAQPRTKQPPNRGSGTEEVPGPRAADRRKVDFQPLVAGT
jgi:hypothetical protein